MLPNSIGNCQSLKKLNLMDCKQIKSLPETVGNLSNLETLYLDNVPIENLPPMKKLKKLKYLSLTSTKVQKLPDDIGQC